MENIQTDDQQVRDSQVSKQSMLVNTVLINYLMPIIIKMTTVSIIR